MALECSDVEKCIREIRLERHWKEDGVGKAEEFLNHIKQRFFDWADQMIKLCNENKYEEHEKIVKEIVELRTYLDNIFPKVCLTGKFNSKYLKCVTHFRMVIPLSSMYFKWDHIEW